MLPCPEEGSDQSVVARHQAYLRTRNVQVASSYPINTKGRIWLRQDTNRADEQPLIAPGFRSSSEFGRIRQLLIIAEI